eukprot:scaffold146658_cov33-Prasinocladus_malaysianus.AAC.1
MNIISCPHCVYAAVLYVRRRGHVGVLPGRHIALLGRPGVALSPGPLKHAREAQPVHPGQQAPCRRAKHADIRCPLGVERGHPDLEGREGPAGRGGP